jgi:hypothetical protein
MGKARQSGLDDHNGKTICTYCNGGYRGSIRAYELNKKGFTSVTIDGGYAVWNEEEKKNKKRPLPLNRLLLKGSITSFSPFLFFMDLLYMYLLLCP